MRSVVGLGLCGSLVIAVSLLASAWDTAFAQRSLTAEQVHRPESSLIALSFAAGEKLQQVAVVDPAKRVIGVYHIDAATGQVELKSVRKIEWDLEMVQFNGTDPLPEEIRSLMEQKR